MNIDLSILEDLAQEVGLYPEAVRTEYSGRGMYGKRCVGIVLDDVTQMLTIGAGLQEALGEIPNARTDSMGRGMILYFPDLQVEDEEDPDEDPEDMDDDS